MFGSVYIVPDDHPTFRPTCSFVFVWSAAESIVALVFLLLCSYSHCIFGFHSLIFFFSGYGNLPLYAFLFLYPLVSSHSISLVYLNSHLLIKQSLVSLQHTTNTDSPRTTYTFLTSQIQSRPLRDIFPLLSSSLIYTA